MNLSIGNKISWEPACGQMIGSIKDISLSQAASGEVVPWIDVEYKYYEKHTNSYPTGRTRLCASDSNLKQLRVERMK